MNKQLTGYVEKTGENTYKVIASTSAIDRQGDSVDQAGWDLASYMLNPVMLWAHDYSQLPVAKVVSFDRTNASQLIALFEFAPKEANPHAGYVKALYDEGFLNAVSVGFIAKERNGNVITKSELLEISFVPVPANQEALRLAYKSLELPDDFIADLEKGAVADELNAEEAMEMKWEKWDAISEVLSALYCVYFDEATPVEDFSKLLTEAIGLLTVVAGNDGEDDDEAKALTISKLKDALGKENLQKFLGEMSEKEGRTLSKKTVKAVDTALESAKALTTVLEELKASSTAGDGEEADTTEVVEEQAEEKISDDALILARSILRGTDRDVEASLKAVNLLIKSRGLK